MAQEKTTEAIATKIIPEMHKAEAQVLDKKNSDLFLTILTQDEIDRCLNNALIIKKRTLENDINTAIIDEKYTIYMQLQEEYNCGHISELESFSMFRLTDKQIADVVSKFGNVSEVVLNEREKYQAVKKLYDTRLGEINTRKYWDKVKSYKDPEPPVFTFEKFFNAKSAKVVEILKSQKPNEKDIRLILDSSNNQLFYTLCAYFLNDTEALKKYTDFEGNPINPDKGILLSGPVGTGKSLFLKAFMTNPKLSYKFYSCKEMADAFGKDGFEVLQEYSGKMRGVKNMFMQTEYGICFDDLGAEDDTSHFGNKRNVMEKILMSRYDKVPFYYTHITTNLSRKQIIDIYKVRIYDRMREMFNMLIIPEGTESKRS